MVTWSNSGWPFIIYQGLISCSLQPCTEKTFPQNHTNSNCRKHDLTGHVLGIVFLHRLTRMAIIVYHLSPFALKVSTTRLVSCCVYVRRSLDELNLGWLCNLDIVIGDLNFTDIVWFLLSHNFLKVVMLKFIIRAQIIFICIFLLLPSHAFALVSEGRPGNPYFDQVLFLQKKVIEDNKVVAVSLAFTDPRSNEDLCLNRMDVFGGLEMFREIPEKNWVLVDFRLQSLIIAEGFAGDADVSWVEACPNVDTCTEWGKQRSLDPQEQERRANISRPKAVVKSNLEDISQRLELGRKLVKVARCRGCHNIEGTGPSHAPSLTWKRIKYDRGWLENYLMSPYRMRPAMDNLMMLNYTSPNAMPSLQREEVKVIAQYLESVAISSAPSDDWRKELWDDYDCLGCHVKLYKSDPLVYQPTVLPENTKAKLEASSTLSLCLGCHTFGDMRTIEKGPPEIVHPFAPDLFLAFEKLDLNFISNFLEEPTHLVPLTKMPNLGLNNNQIIEIKDIAQEIKEEIEAGRIKPNHMYYNLEKGSTNN